MEWLGARLTKRPIWTTVARCRLRSDVDVLDPALRCGYGKAVFAHAFEVKGDGCADFGLCFSNGGTGCNAARQVWDVCRVVAFSFLDDDCVAHRNLRT